MPLIEFLGVAATAVVIVYGGTRVLGETLSLGALVAFIAYIRMFFQPIRDIAEKYNVMQNAMASAERIFLILDTHDRLPQAPSPGASAVDRIRTISFESVSFEYVAGEPVLQDVSFDLSAGQTVAIVGPTGSGKTTLMNLLIRFYDPGAGRICINGCDLKELTTADLRSSMALVTQDPFLFSGTARSNIVQGRDHLSEQRLQEIIAASNCRALIDRLPQGVDTPLSEGGRSLSSGERQLLSIARAFARDPQLILLDEATSYIDSATEQKIQAALSNLMHNRTAIIIAHRLSTARPADRIIVLNRGRLIEMGSHQALMDSRGFYYRLNQVQG